MFYDSRLWQAVLPVNSLNINFTFLILIKIADRYSHLFFFCNFWQLFTEGNTVPCRRFLSYASSIQAPNTLIFHEILLKFTEEAIISRIWLWFWCCCCCYFSFALWFPYKFSREARIDEWINGWMEWMMEAWSLDGWINDIE